MMGKPPSTADSDSADTRTQKTTSPSSTQQPDSSQTIPVAPAQEDAAEETSDTDSLLAQLEAELDLSDTAATSGIHSHDNGTILSTSPTTASLLAARKAELQSQSKATASSSQTPLTNGHIQHSTQSRGLQGVSSEESLIRSTADASAAVVLFYSAAFPSSMHMRENLETLARTYAIHHSSGTESRKGSSDERSPTLFFAAEAEKCEWLCRRLKIRVLPVVVGYVDGKEVGRLVGFEGLKAGEKAGWRDLAWVVGRWGGEWSGTFGVGKTGGGLGVLGDGWEAWCEVGNGGRKIGGGDDSDGEVESDERERRRDAGYVGGGGGSGRLKAGGGSGRRLRGTSDDDDWD